MAFIDSAISLLPPGIPPPLPIFNRISNTARFGMGKAPRGRKGGRSKGGRYFAPKARGEGLTKRQVRPLKKKSRNPVSYFSMFPVGHGTTS
jgi:hypothetical protein